MLKNWYTWICYFCIMLLMGACYIFYVNYFLLTFIIVMIALPVLSFIALRYYHDKLTVSIEAPDRVERGEEITVKVILTNTGVLPIIRTQIILNMENPFYPQKEEYNVVCGVAVGKPTEIKLKLTSEYCGLVSFSAPEIRIWDYTGLWDMEHKSDASALCSVIAKPLEIDFTTEAIGGAGLTELVEQDTKGNDSSQVIDTRDYRPGDKPNRIHWKLSTKLDRLIVKEYGSISSNDVLVLLNLYRPEKKFKKAQEEQKFNSYFDSIFDAYITLLNHLLAEKRPFTLCWYAPELGELKREDITGMEEGLAVLSQVYYEVVGHDPQAAIELTRRTMDEFGEFICITPGYEESRAIEGETEELFTVGTEPLCSCIWVKH